MNALLAAVALLAAGAAPAKPETPTQIAVRLASRQHPKALWRLAETRTADFTYDRKPDLMLLGFEGTAVFLVVVEGPITDRSRLLSLRLRSGVDAADAVCGPPDAVQTNTEPPSCEPGRPDCERVAQLLAEGGENEGLGLVLIHKSATGYCPAFHVYYDGGGLAWWRTPPD